jgi:hypothetical protein
MGGAGLEPATSCRPHLDPELHRQGERLSSTKAALAELVHKLEDG